MSKLGAKFRQQRMALALTKPAGIARRYFVVNGFDGALTMLGILVGFYHTGAGSDPAGRAAVLSACLGAAIALGISGVSSAYISEAAERHRELQTLENAMVTDMDKSAHAQAARLTPVGIGLVNGAAPLLLGLLIITPLWLPLWFAGGWPAWATVESPTWFALLFVDPLLVAMALGLAVIFFLGVFIGRISGHFWLISGFQTLLIALVTGILIVLLTPAAAAL